MDEAILQKVQEALTDNDKVFRRSNIEHVYKRTRNEWQKRMVNLLVQTGKDLVQTGKDLVQTKEGINYLQILLSSIVSEHLRSDLESSSNLTHEEEKYAKYGLAKSTILDSGSTTHICNDLSCMYDYVEQKGSMLAGKAECQILGYRKDSSQTLHHQMNAKNIHWDSRTRELYHKNGVLCYTPRHFGQTVLRYVLIDATFFVQMENDLGQMEDKKIQVAISTRNDLPKEGTPQKEQSHEKDRTIIIQDSTNDVSVPMKGSAPWPTPDLSSPILQSEHEDEDDDIDELSIMY
ncbi:hypothetical protein VC83_05398 [Pseudogymnoascus destructans]|uniref:Uncharacterized protein n=1 Tax=Pseudogymnoascus destructans TaxID=655981 RepID=A0A177A7G3_9PEZI|nr:uncharacterized protein VC83_05398 [Pseudogymnoascus destructans]OAF58097.1 hypothetical protein VC83_05398 [Pseudogymnoascus destructans]